MITEEKIHVMLVDDHFSVLMGLRACLQPEADMEVVADAGNGDEAIEQFRQHQPDITLMDLQLPELGGIATIRAILEEFPNARIIVLTTRQGEDDIHLALSEGARSYLTKAMSRQEILKTIRAIHQGDDYLPEGVQSALASRQTKQSLTPREMEVLGHLVCGRSNKEIAAALSLAEITIKVHVSHMLEKMQVLDRSQIVVEALQRGMIHLDDAT